MKSPESISIPGIICTAFQDIQRHYDLPDVGNQETILICQTLRLFFERFRVTFEIGTNAHSDVKLAGDNVEPLYFGLDVTFFCLGSIYLDLTNALYISALVSLLLVMAVLISKFQSWFLATPC